MSTITHETSLLKIPLPGFLGGKCLDASCPNRIVVKDHGWSILAVNTTDSFFFPISSHLPFHPTPCNVIMLLPLYSDPKAVTLAITEEKNAFLPRASISNYSPN